MRTEPSDVERAGLPEATQEYLDSLEDVVERTRLWLETAIEDLDFSSAEDALLDLKEGN